MKANPADMEILADRGEAQVLRGEMLNASYFLDVVLRRQPDHTRAWTLLGFARARMNDAPGFVREWGMVQASNTGAWKDLVTRCAGTGLWDAARTYIAASPAGQEGLVIPDLRLADIAIELKQPQFAQRFLEQAEEAHPNDPAPWLMLCDLALAAKDTTKAEQWLAEAEKRAAFPEDVELRRSQGALTTEQPSHPVRTIIR